MSAASPQRPPGPLLEGREARRRGGRPRNHAATPCGNPSSCLERAIGIEPTSPGWKPGALPLSYTRNRQSRRWESNPLPRAYQARAPPPGPRRQLFQCNAARSAAKTTESSMEQPGVAPGFPACETGVFLLDDCPSRSRPTRNRTSAYGFGIRLVTMTFDLRGAEAGNRTPRPESQSALAPSVLPQIQIPEWAELVLFCNNLIPIQALVPSSNQPRPRPSGNLRSSGRG